MTGKAPNELVLKIRKKRIFWEPVGNRNKIFIFFNWLLLPCGERAKSSLSLLEIYCFPKLQKVGGDEGGEGGWFEWWRGVATGTRQRFWADPSSFTSAPDNQVCFFVFVLKLEFVINR